MSTHHRRDFVRSLALGASAAALTAPAARADDEKGKAGDKEAKGKDHKSEAAPPKTEVDARMEVVLARFGKQLDEAARRTVRAEVEGHVRRAEALRKVPLDNGDGPFPVFHPYRAPLA